MTAGGGIRFGQYVLLKRIARGGMAEVFLAQQRGLEGFDRRVAVKRILPHLTDAGDFVKMFLGEAKLAAQLTHPNVVHIYDFGKVDSDYFIAMEFVDGVNAGQIWKHGELESDPISPTLIARIGADCAAALNYAHQATGPNGKPMGLVHRDVSPANIMISFDGAVKLCDFGIAKAAALQDQLTNPGQVKGKYAYMSPEQTTASPLDGRSDVFSLGIVLWELLSGKTIVGRSDAVDAMRAIRDGKIEPIQKAAPRTPVALAKAVNWALETRRERRATAADLSTALEAFIKSSPELATPMQLAQWVRSRFVREMTGPQAQESSSLSVGPGTVVSTGTNLSMVTPSSLIAASRTPNPFSTDDNAETIAVAPMTTTDRTQMDISLRAADEATLPRSLESTMELDPDDEDQDPHETMVRSGAFKQIAMNQGGVPTRETPAVPPVRRTPVPGTEPHVRRTPVPGTETLRTPASKPPRPLVLFGVLAGLALISFVIALSAKSCGSTAVARDAAAMVVVARDAAVVVDAVVVDAAPTVPRVQMAFLEIPTAPPGATVKIGDQQRTSPAQFALPVGSYHIVAELDGWEPEERDVVVEREHFVQEIAFTRRKATVPPVVAKKEPLGKLTAKTTPWSEVFLAGKKLGDTPFADLELPVGTYQVTFTSEGHKPVVKKVPIVAGKNTKVSFTFAD